MCHRPFREEGDGDRIAAARALDQRAALAPLHKRTSKVRLWFAGRLRASRRLQLAAELAQLVERFLAKGEAAGSIPVFRIRAAPSFVAFHWTGAAEGSGSGKTKATVAGGISS
jgi:hypothetical protein